MTASVPPGATNTTGSVSLDGPDPYRATQGRNVLAEIADKRARQDAKWGEQNHPDGTGHKKFAVMRDAARSARERAAAHGAVTESGYVTWRHILREEFYEALAETDPKALRAELIQVAAVAVAWVECIDRRVHPSTEETSP